MTVRLYTGPGGGNGEFDIDRGIRLAECASQSRRTHGDQGMRVLGSVFGYETFDSFHEHPLDENWFVVRDIQSGLYIKSYPYRDDAELQFAAMNAMAGALDERGEGVSAVRHFALIDGPGQLPVAVIEPATGRRVSQLTTDISERKRILRETRRRLDVGLGMFASRAIANDLVQMQNIGGNVYIDREGDFQLIDQPVFSIASALLARRAIRSLGWKEPIAHWSPARLTRQVPHSRRGGLHDTHKI